MGNKNSTKAKQPIPIYVNGIASGRESQIKGKTLMDKLMCRGMTCNLDCKDINCKEEKLVAMEMAEEETFAYK